MIDLNRIKEPKIKNLIFVADGGIGKCIASTAVVKRLAEEFPDKRIIVMTGYPDIFLYNPNVYKIFNFGNPLYFYDDYVNDESFVIRIEPYTDYGYMNAELHLIDAWCKMIGIERKGAMPEMFFMDNELDAGRFYVEKLTNNNKKKFIMLQWVGGMIPQDKNGGSLLDALGRMHRRALPQKVAQKLANKLIARDYAVGVVQHENFPNIEGAERLFFPNQPSRGIIALLKFAEGFIGVDSFIHHAGACFGTKGLVIWGGTNPAKLGYDYQKNIVKSVCKTPMCHRPDSYVFDATAIGSIWNCPFNTKCLEFDADELIQAYESLGLTPKKEDKSDGADKKE